MTRARRLVFVGLTVAAVFFDSLAADTAPKRPEKQKPTFTGQRAPEERRSLWQAWKARRANRRQAAKGRAVKKMGIAPQQRGISAPVILSSGSVGRPTVVINDAGQVLFVKHFSDLCDVDTRTSPPPFDCFFGTVVGAACLSGCTPMQLVVRNAVGTEVTIAREGDDLDGGALDTGTALAGFAEFFDMNNSGVAAFKAAIAGMSNIGEDAGGIFTAGISSPLTKIIQTGDTISGLTICDFGNYISINNAGQVVFDAYTRIGVTCNDINKGIYRFTPGLGVQLLAANGSAVPSGGTISNFVDQDIFELNSLGHVAFSAQLSDGDHAVYIAIGPGVFTEVARSGNAGPGGNFEQLAGNPDINDTDQVVFKAAIGGDGNVLTEDDGTDTLVLFTPPSTHQRIVSGITGSPFAPGDDVGLRSGGLATGVTFEGLGAYFDLNNSGNVVFKADLVGLPPSGTQDESGTLAGIFFWNDTTNLIREVARTDTADDRGDPVYGFFTDVIVLNNADTVLLGGKFDPALTAYDEELIQEALYTWTAGGGLTTVLRTGDTLDGNIVTSIFGQHLPFARQINDSSTVAAAAFISNEDPDDNTIRNGKLFIGTGLAITADLSIAKTDNPDPVLINSTLTYTLTITNSGPNDATSVTVTDMLPSGTTFVSASGTGFSCSLIGSNVTCTRASLAAGTTVTITIRVTTPATAATLTNTANVSSATSDPVPANNTTSITTNMISAVCPDPITNMDPANGATNVPTTGTLRWRTRNADSITVNLGEGDAGCTTLLGTTTGNSIDYSNLKGGTVYRWRIIARNRGCPNPVQSPCFYFVTAEASCNNLPPELFEPASGATDQVSPLKFRWGAVALATGYQLFIAVNGGAPQLLATTTGQNATEVTIDVPTGQIDWFVVPLIPGCIGVPSARGSFNASNCRAPGATIVSSHPNVSDNTDYLALWKVVEGAVKYIVFESLPNRCQGPEKPDASCFEGARQFETTATQMSFVHDVDRPTKFHYRVEPVGCLDKRGPSSSIATTVVDVSPFNLTAAFGYDKDLHTSFVVNLPSAGKSTLQTGFTASSDKGFLTVTPSSGTIPPAGTTLTVTANPRGLPVGSTTGTVTVTNTGTGGVIANVPISVTLVTPVTAVGKGTPPPNALVIPAVSHVDGSNSSWQTDTAVVNTSGTKLQYEFSFTPSGENGTQEGKQTVIDVESGQTVTFKDLVKVLFGRGSLNDGQNGVLEIRPLNFDGKLNPQAVKLATIASSRTYNESPAGSVGQFIKGIAFSEFIDKAVEGRSAVLSMQHVAQSASFRTNLGLVEGEGEAATVVIRAFNNAGQKLHESTIDLKPGEHQQLNSFLTTKGIGLEDGRMEVEVTSGTGRVTAYASVVDNLSTDPILVPGVNLAKLLSTKYAIPGVADLTTATNNWRTDLRVFNGGTASVTATLQYFKQNEATAVKTAELTIAPGEVKAVDNLLQSLFGEVNSGGVVHITTPGPSSLVASARTYDRRANGTFGQLVEAVTPDDAFGATDRATQILQIEESPRFRSNLGIVEVTGNPATVEVSATQPDSKVETKISVPLRANEFVQFPGILKLLNLGPTYHGRIAVRVVSGTGKISAYGSVIDNLSQDPTFVNGQ